MQRRSAGGDAGIRALQPRRRPAEPHGGRGRAPDIVERLTQELPGRLRYAEARKLPTDEDAADGLSPEELQRLRSLGYIR